MQPPRRQTPVRGGRQRMSAGLLKSIEREVNRTAARFHVSRSFVVAVALAQHFGVSEQETFEEPRQRLRVVGGRR